MIKEFVERFNKNRLLLEDIFSEKHPETYLDVVKNVITILEDGYGSPSSLRISEIDYGDYQGTLVYVIAAKGYQPNTYWYVKVYYGSCSGCDTLQQICKYSCEKPTENQVKQYMTLALHIVQGLKEMGEETVE